MDGFIRWIMDSLGILDVHVVGFVILSASVCLLLVSMLFFWIAFEYLKHHDEEN